MTTALAATEIVSQLSAQFPGAVEEAGTDAVLVKGEHLPAVVEYLKTAAGLKFDYLNFITAVDYYITSINISYCIFSKTHAIGNRTAVYI